MEDTHTRFAKPDFQLIDYSLRSQRLALRHAVELAHHLRLAPTNSSRVPRSLLVFLGGWPGLTL